MTSQAFFLEVDNGQRFCLFHPARLQGTGIPRGQVVYIHPFTEEMNKSRRMAAIQARALANAGFDVLQIDLLGCGDSSGDFGDATWEAWLQDVTVACQWLHAHHRAREGHSALPTLWLWGLRAGCLLASQAAQRLPVPCNFLFWAPAISGKPLLQQFLRLKAAADLSSGNAKAVMQAMRADLAQGVPVEVAGYLLAPALSRGLEQAVLTPPTSDQPGRAPCRVVWIELSTRDDASLSPVSVKGIGEWQAAGCDVQSQLVNGPAFWQTTEIEDAPALIATTTAALTVKQQTPADGFAPPALP